MDALPEALVPEALVPDAPDVPVAEPLVPVPPLLGRLMLPPEAPPPIVALARMKWSAFDALLEVDVLAAVPDASAGWRQPVTVTFSSDCLPPACLLLLDCVP